MSIRTASHAGTWYSNDSVKLTETFDHLKNLRNICAQNGDKQTRAIICPHAGYQFCAETALHGWGQIDPSVIKRIFVLGPSHHFHLNGCALPHEDVREYDTPFGPIPLDMQVLSELRRTLDFGKMTKEQDEDEHSIELMLPYMKYVMKDKLFTIVPIIVGELTLETQVAYAKKLKLYFDDAAALIVISSDFCHWGKRFGYTYLPNMDVSEYAIHDAIQNLDSEAMKTIEEQDGDAFSAYLANTKNTICGRNPILILLRWIQLSSNFVSCKTRRHHYSQSTKLTDIEGFSVSYASMSTCVSLSATASR